MLGFILVLWAIRTGAVAAQPVASFQEASIKIDKDAAEVWVEVTLSAPANQRVTVDYGCEDGFGPEGAIAPRDYTRSSGTLAFPAGTTSQQVRVKFEPNAVAEQRKHFSIYLKNAKNAKLGMSLVSVFLGPPPLDENGKPAPQVMCEMPLPVIPPEDPPAAHATLFTPAVIIPTTIILAFLTGCFMLCWLKRASEAQRIREFSSLTNFEAEITDSK